MKFLIVDDAAVMRKVIIRELIDLNALETDIVQAEDGEQALKKLQSQTFDLILMDWNMPNMLGIDAVTAIRAQGNQTPILMVTTEGEKANVIRAIQAGATNYLVKPFSKDDFQEKVTQLIGVIPPSASVAPEPEIVETSPKHELLDVENGRIAIR